MAFTLLSGDLETHFSTDYTLKKMTMQEYLCDRRFEAYMFSYSINLGPVRLVVGQNNIQQLLDQFDWDSTIFAAFNTAFDGAVLSQHFGVKAARYYCAMSVSRALGISNRLCGNSLEATSNFMRDFILPDIPHKGKELASAKNQRLKDMTPELLQEIASYCIKDTEILNKLISYQLEHVPPEELEYQDIILKSYIDPALKLDALTLAESPDGQELAVVADPRPENECLEIVVRMWQRGEQPSIALLKTARAATRKNDFFVQMLRHCGGRLASEGGGAFIIPQKISPKTGKLAYAFSKTDNEWQELQYHEDEVVRKLVALKAEGSSNQGSTRTQTFLNISHLGLWRVAYNIHGAHTGRLTGGDKQNAQNLKSDRDGGDNSLRRSIVAAEGKLLVTSDLSQIEPRLMSFVTNDKKKIEMFNQGGDPYAYTAVLVYGGDASLIQRYAKVREGETPHPRQKEFSDLRSKGKTMELALGYGMGTERFWMRSLSDGGVFADRAESDYAHMMYKKGNPCITAFWTTCERVLEAMINRSSGYFGGPTGNLLYYDGNRCIGSVYVPGIRLPSGIWLNYPNLRRGVREQYGQQKPCILYDDVLHAATTEKNPYGRSIRQKYIYGALLTENILQALAYEVMKFQGILIAKKYKIVMNTHDEYVCSVDADEAGFAQEYIINCMLTPPPWLGNVVALDVEAKVGKTYAETH